MVSDFYTLLYNRFKINKFKITFGQPKFILVSVLNVVYILNYSNTSHLENIIQLRLKSCSSTSACVMMSETRVVTHSISSERPPSAFPFPL